MIKQMTFIRDLGKTVLRPDFLLTENTKFQLRFVHYHIVLEVFFWSWKNGARPKITKY